MWESILELLTCVFFFSFFFFIPLFLAATMETSSPSSSLSSSSSSSSSSLLDADGRYPIPRASESILSQVCVNKTAAPVFDLHYDGVGGEDHIKLEEKQEYDRILQEQGKIGVSPFMLKKFETESVKNWDRFYKRNANRFYKDRHYLT